MLFRAVVIVMLSSLLVIEVAGQVDQRVARAMRRPMSCRPLDQSGWANRARPENDNRRPSAARGATPAADDGETVLVDIRQAELDRLLAAPDLAGQARIVPSFRDGAATGVRIFAIAPDSLFAAIGLRGGDLVTSINDRPVTAGTPETLLPSSRDHAPFADITGRRGGHLLRIIVLVHA